jgi:hypothetical protein
MLIENTDTSSDTGSFDTAVAAFEQILDREDAATTDQPKRKPERKEAEGDEPEALTADPEDETADDDDADAEEADSDDDEGAEEEADADAEDDDEGDEDPDRLVTVKIDGKTQKIKLSEAIAGYQRQADYSRKTEALASERKAIEAEVAAVRQERGQYAYLLENLAKQLDTAAAREPDWERLKAEDPVEFAVKRLEWQEMTERRRAIHAEQQRLQVTAAREAQQAFKSTVEAERAKLHEAIPAWKDEKRWAKDRVAIREYGQKLGFTEEELTGAADSRAIVALYKAMKFDQLAEKKPVPVRPSANAPRPLPTGSANKPPARVTERIKAEKRLAKTGSVDDAAKFFEHLL